MVVDRASGAPSPSTRARSACTRALQARDGRRQVCGLGHRKTSLLMASTLQSFVSMPVLVKHIMTAPVVALFEEQSLPLADDIMHFKHLRHLPVVDDDNQLVGLVSHRDILRAQISACPDPGRLLMDHRFGCLPVVDAAGRLIGIVTERDYLRFAVQAIEIHD